MVLYQQNPLSTRIRRKKRYADSPIVRSRTQAPCGDRPLPGTALLRPRFRFQTMLATNNLEHFMRNVPV